MKPKKSLGQNFLINPSIPVKMVEAGGIDGEFGVLEIGPGLGALTSELAKRAAKVVAVELDSSLLPRLRENLRGFKNVSIIEGDALKLPLADIIEEQFGGLRRAVFGNLPYYITSPLVMKLLEERTPAEFVEVMVQKEAAIRLAAPEGSRECGAVTLAVRYYAEPEILFDVSPGSFFPAPKVTSSVVRFRLRDKPPVTPADEQRMFAVIRAAFSQRRKTAVNAVTSGLSMEKKEVTDAFAAAGIDLTARAERITLREYAALSALLNN